MMLELHEVPITGERIFVFFFITTLSVFLVLLLVGWNYFIIRFLFYHRFYCISASLYDPIPIEAVEVSFGK